MTQIRDLFDSTRALNRTIEKVITYQKRDLCGDYEGKGEVVY